MQLEYNKVGLLYKKIYFKENLKIGNYIFQYFSENRPMPTSM